MYITVLLFVIELVIATYVHDQFIRPFVGDVLVVMLLFSFVRIFYKGNARNLGFGVLLFAFAIEISQYVELIKILGIEQHKIATIILGTTFNWIDIAAYILGAIVSVYLDKKYGTK
ncbi:MAG: DUF2809 domain-containing protein [Polaribacter sp.]|nr:DUF2809 domain-containing protein [Polaribacter sp.]